MFSDHNANKLDINNKRIPRKKNSYDWKLKNVMLNTVDQGTNYKGNLENVLNSIEN